MFLLVVLVLFQTLTFTAFASTGGDDGGSVWDLISGIGGFFSDLFTAIGNAVTWLLDGIKNLFIPHTDYFPRMYERLRDALGTKFGGLLSSMDYLRSRFGQLRAYHESDLFTLRFPASFPLLGGLSVNLMGGAAGAIGIVRGALSGFMMLWTAAFAYRKVQTLISA